jgi:hypothetical protein
MKIKQYPDHVKTNKAALRTITEKPNTVNVFQKLFHLVIAVAP